MAAGITKKIWSVPDLLWFRPQCQQGADMTQSKTGDSKAGTACRAPTKPTTLHRFLFFSPFTLHPCLSPHNQRRGETVADSVTDRNRETALKLFDLPTETPDQ